MHILFSTSLTSVLSFALIGCMAANPSRVDIAEEENTLQELKAEALMDEASFKQSQLEDEMDAIPKWVIEPPRADKVGFYGVGTATDGDLLTALRKANLQAKYSLASTIKSELSGEDTMTGSGSGEYRYVINNFVSKTNLTGTEIIKRKVVPINGVYRASLLLKLPYDAFNQIINNQAKADNKPSLSSAYKRLLDKQNKPLSKDEL